MFLFTTLLQQVAIILPISGNLNHFSFGSIPLVGGGSKPFMMYLKVLHTQVLAYSLSYD